MRIKPGRVIDIGVLIVSIGTCVAALASIPARIQHPEWTETQLYLATGSTILIGMAIVGIGCAVVWFGKRRGG